MLVQQLKTKNDTFDNQIKYLSTYNQNLQDQLNKAQNSLTSTFVNDIYGDKMSTGITGGNNEMQKGKNKLSNRFMEIISFGIKHKKVAPKQNEEEYNNLILD